MILFAAQIPVLAVPNFSYEFFTGLTVALILELASSQLGFFFRFYFGAGITLLISPEIQNIEVGINLFAVIVLLYLKKAAKLLSPPVTLTETPSEPG